jgi:hypothetical protein
LLLTGPVQLTRLLRLSGTIELAGLLLSLPVRYGRQWRLTGLPRQAVLPRLAGTVQLTRRLLSGPDLSGQPIRPLLAGWSCLPDRPVRIDEAGIGAAEFALLEHDLPADILHRVKLAHKALVALHHRLRNRQRHRGEARAARARADGEAARALGEKAELCAGTVVDLDPADPSVRVGVKFDRDVPRIVGGSTFRHFDEAGGAANAERRRRRRDLHVAGFCHRGGNEGGGALGDVEDRRVALAAVLIDVIVDGDLGARLEIKGGGRR